MVFVSICQHASSAFIFVSTSTDKILLASSEHFINFLLGGMYPFLKGNVLRQVTKPSSLQPNMPVKMPKLHMSKSVVH